MIETCSTAEGANRANGDSCENGAWTTTMQSALDDLTPSLLGLLDRYIEIQLGKPSGLVGFWSRHPQHLPVQDLRCGPVRFHLTQDA